MLCRKDQLSISEQRQHKPQHAMQDPVLSRNDDAGEDPGAGGCAQAESRQRFVLPRAV